MAAEYLLLRCRLWFIEALVAGGFALRQRLSSTKRQREAQGSEPVARSAAAEVTKEWKGGGGEGNDKSLSERTRREQEEEEKSNKRESEKE